MVGISIIEGMDENKIGVQLDGQDLYERQKEILSEPAYIQGPLVIAVGLEMAENAGAVLRLADAAGCVRVIFVHRYAYKLKRLRKTARNCLELVDWEVWEMDRLLDDADSLPPLVALELTSGSENIYKTVMPRSCGLVIGSERNGIPDTVLARCQQAIHIPMYGVNGSMNVTHALGIALFEWRRQQEKV